MTRCPQTGGECIRCGDERCEVEMKVKRKVTKKVSRKPEPKLAPCPWCGESTWELVPGVGVSCYWYMCRVCCGESPVEDTEAEATEALNTGRADYERGKADEQRAILRLLERWPTGATQRRATVDKVIAAITARGLKGKVKR